MLTQDEFYELLDAVEAQAGAHLPGKCRPERIDYEIGEAGLTQGCMREARLAIPYEREEVGIEGTVVVCAFDDLVHLWPRYAA